MPRSILTVLRSPTIKGLHTTSSLRWSAISRFYRSRGAQIISLVPILGYFILWSDQLTPLFEYTKNLGPGGFLSPITRLYCLYFGSLFVLVGWLIWQVYCPGSIRKFERSDTFVTTCVTSADAAFKTVATMIARRFFSITQSHTDNPTSRPIYDTDAPYGQWPWHFSVQNMENLLHSLKLQSRNEDTNTVLTLYWRYLNYSLFKWRLTTALAAAIGTGIFAMPSIEVFFLVLRSVVRKLI